MRPGACISSTCVAPFVHSRPAFAGCSLSPATFDTTKPSPAAPGPEVTLIPQPTPQYEHTARTPVGGALGRGPAESAIVLITR